MAVPTPGTKPRRADSPQSTVVDVVLEVLVEVDVLLVELVLVVVVLDVDVLVLVVLDDVEVLVVELVV